MVTQATSLNAARLQFTDSAGCKRWIAIAVAHQSAIGAAIADRTDRAGPPGGYRSRRIVAHAGNRCAKPVHFVQSELARKYTAKPLPLDANEIALWTRTLELWQEFTDAYLVCRDAHVQGDLALRNHGALIVMRCLHYIGKRDVRALPDLPPGSRRPVEKPAPAVRVRGTKRFRGYAGHRTHLNGQESDSSCRAAYAQALLAHLANPFALSGRQMQFFARWIEKWSGLVGLSRDPLPPSAIPALCVDVAGSAGPTFADRMRTRREPALSRPRADRPHAAPDHHPAQARAVARPARARATTRASRAAKTC